MIPFATVVRVAKATALVVGMAIGLIALGLAGPGSPAKADWYSFSYNNGLVGTGTSILFTGELSGTMTSGTLTVTGYRNLDYNGTPLNATNGWDDPSIDSVSNASWDPPSGILPFVTTDGSAMDLILIANSQTNYLAFGRIPETGPLSFYNFLSELPVSLSPNFAGQGEAFNAVGWSLTPVAVPEPSQVVLLASAGVVFGGWRLRRFRRGRPVGDATMADG